MASMSYYRTEAERFRELADHSPDADMAKRWRNLAADYEKLADALEGLERGHAGAADGCAGAADAAAAIQDRAARRQDVNPSRVGCAQAESAGT